MNLSLSFILIAALLPFSGCKQSGSAVKEVSNPQVINGITGVNGLPSPERAYLVHGKDTAIWVRYRINRTQLDASIRLAGMFGSEITESSQQEGLVNEMMYPDKELAGVNFFVNHGKLIQFYDKKSDFPHALFLITAEPSVPSNTDEIILFLGSF